MTEPCNRHRRKDGQCVSPSTRQRTGSASLRAAGVGELRRVPEDLAPAEAGGHATANMVLGPFPETKGSRRSRAKPRWILKHTISSSALAIQSTLPTNDSP